MPLKPAESYLPKFLADCNCAPTSSQVPFYLAHINLVLTMLADVTVSPVSLTGPPLTSPSGTAGGPVVGTGSLT